MCESLDFSKVRSSSLFGIAHVVIHHITTIYFTFIYHYTNIFLSVFIQVYALLKRSCTISAVCVDAISKRNTYCQESFPRCRVAVIVPNVPSTWPFTARAAIKFGLQPHIVWPSRANFAFHFPQREMEVQSLCCWQMVFPCATPCSPASPCQTSTFCYSFMFLPLCLFCFLTTM